MGKVKLLKGRGGQYNFHPPKPRKTWVMGSMLGANSHSSLPGFEYKVQPFVASIILA
jgi:hypothetical protein